MNEEKLNQLLGKMVTELGAAVMGAHIIIGDKLGLYKALNSNGGLTSEQLAEETGTLERYVRRSGCRHRPLPATSNTTRLIERSRSVRNRPWYSPMTTARQTW